MKNATKDIKVIPQKNSPLDDILSYHFLLKCKIKKIPHHKIMFCDLKTFWPRDIDFDNMFCLQHYQLQKHLYPLSDKFHQLEDVSKCISSVIQNKCDQNTQKIKKFLRLKKINMTTQALVNEMHLIKMC